MKRAQAVAQHLSRAIPPSVALGWLHGVLGKLSPVLAASRWLFLLPAAKRPPADRFTYVPVSPAVTGLLQRARLHLWWEEGLVRVLRSLIVGLFLVLLGSLVDALIPLPMRPVVFWFLAAALILGAIVVAVRARPSLWRTARLLDRRLGLRQQLATAMELVARDARGRLEVTQVEGVRALASQIRVEPAFPTRTFRPEIKMIATLLLCTLGLNLLASFVNLRLVGPSSGWSSSREELAQITELEKRLAEAGLSSASASRKENDPVTQLANLLRQLTGQPPDSQSTAADLAAAELLAQEQMSDSFRKEQALSLLAEAWKNGSATNQAAENLEKGQYQDAATEMKNLAEGLPQLSAAAVAEMARGLEEAAAGTEGLDADLARTMERTAQALTQGDRSKGREGLQELSQQTGEVGESMASRAQLGETLDEIEQALRSLEGNPGMPGEGETAGEAGAAPGGAGAGAGTAGEEESGGQQASEGTGTEVQRSSSEVLSALSQQKVAPMTLSDDLQEALDAQGEAIRAQPRPGAGRSQIEEEEVDDPNTRGSVDTQSAGGGQRVGFSGRVSAAPDSSLVPWGARPLVRDYFSALVPSGQ